MRRPQVGYNDLTPFDKERPALPKAVTEQVEIALKYSGYIEKQLKQVEDFKRMEARKIPPDLDFMSLTGLRTEAKQKLERIRPLNIGQASRISGVSPADVAALMIHLERRKQERQ